MTNYHNSKTNQAKRARRKARRKIARNAVISHFKTSEYASNLILATLLSDLLKLPAPTSKASAAGFIRKHYKKLANKPSAPAKRKRKSSEEFYKSQSWRDLRYIALRNSEGACECCGAKAGDGVQIHVDHIKPRSKYPDLELDLENLQVLCDDCNIGKSNYFNDDWRGLKLVS